MFFFKKKAKQEVVIENNENEVVTPDKPRDGFTFGAQEKFALEDSTDVMVVGNLRGKLKKGSEIYVVNFGDDNTPVALTTVIDIEKQDAVSGFYKVDEAKDCNVSIRVCGDVAATIKPGTVFHSKDAKISEVHNSYINALGNAYVRTRGLELSEEDIEKMSITDLAESWRLFGGYMSTKSDITPDERQSAFTKIEKVAKIIVDKLLKLDHIYVVYNKNTSEPHMYSQISKNGDRYESTPLSMTLVTDAYYNVYAKKFSEGALELKRVENEEDKNGIYNFLGGAFYLNGVQGIEFLYSEAFIGADTIIPKPSFEGARDVDIPVTNPDVERWILMLSQVGQPKNENEKVIFNLYYHFLSKALTEAKFIVPMKLDDEQMEKAKGDEGKFEVTQDTKMQVAVQDGRGDRKAVRMYTDWMRLREEYGEGWGGVINSIDDVIEKYDVAINVTKNPYIGCYVSKESYQSMKQTDK